MDAESYSSIRRVGKHVDVEFKIHLHHTAEALPEKSGEYLCLAGYRSEWVVLHYSAKHQLFNAFDNHPAEDARKYAIPVTRWAELPTA